MKPARPLVLAHRGFHAEHPENSLAAFAAAFEAGADGIECDLQKAPDGRYVICHDPPAERDASALPRLEDVLALLPDGAFLNLELKADTLKPADCEPVWRSVAVRRRRGPLLVSSFDPRLLYPFKARGIPVGLLLGREALDLGAAGIARVLLRLRPHYLNLPILMFEVLGRRRARALAAALKAAGFSLAFWTVNTAAEAALARGLARIIITDDVPAFTRGV